MIDTHSVIITNTARTQRAWLCFASEAPKSSSSPVNNPQLLIALSFLLSSVSVAHKRLFPSTYSFSKFGGIERRSHADYAGLSRVLPTPPIGFCIDALFTNSQSITSSNNPSSSWIRLDIPLPSTRQRPQASLNRPLQNLLILALAIFLLHSHGPNI